MTTISLILIALAWIIQLKDVLKKKNKISTTFIAAAFIFLKLQK